MQIKTNRRRLAKQNLSKLKLSIFRKAKNYIAG